MLHFFSLQQLCFHCFCFWWWWQSQRKENRKKSGLEIYAKEERHCTRETFLHFNEANVRRSKDRIKDVGRVVCHHTRIVYNQHHHVVYDCLHSKFGFNYKATPRLLHKCNNSKPLLLLFRGYYSTYYVHENELKRRWEKKKWKKKTRCKR